MDYTTLPHLLPADQVVKNAARGTLDPEWRYRQLRGFPSYMAVTAAAYEQELKHAMRQAGIRSGMRVLDAACGPGMGSRYLLEVGASEVTGYDINPAMLALAKQLHPLDDFAGRLTFQQGDLNHPLPFDDNTFDAVWMGDIWMPQALAEVRRVTRSGGTIILKMTGIAAGISYLWDLDFQARVEAALRRGIQPLASPSSNGEQTPPSFYGQFRQSGQWQHINMRTTIIERVAPVPPLFEVETLQWFGLWAGAIIKEQLSLDDWKRLSSLYDIHSPEYLFRRVDGYFVQTLTLCSGVVQKETENGHVPQRLQMADESVHAL